MPKFKAGMFSWALLSVTAICAASPTLAQSTAPETTPKEATPAVVPTTTPAAVAPTPKEDTTKPDKLAVSDQNVQILKSFNDRYQCGIANIDQAITRSDFANNIAVCLTSIEVKLAQNPSAVSTDDLAQLKALTSQFMDEVSYLGNRVETLEKKVTGMQKASSFSTTTKLAGEVIVGLTTNSSQTRTGDTNGGNTQFANRVRLNFDTTFTGKDRLRTRLQARNLTSLNGGSGTPNSLNGGTGTNATRLGFDGDENNGVNVSLLQYTLPVFDKSRLIVETVGSEFNENMYTFNPLLASSGTGSLTRFGRYNPVYRQSGDGAAATLDYKMSPEFSVALGYAIPGAFAASVANNPNNDAGLFGGNYAGIVQLRYQPSPDIDLGLSYARSYHAGGSGVTGSTGTGFANNPFNGAPTVANHYSFLASTKISPGFVLSGWVGLTNANVEAGGSRTGSADILNGAITAAFTDVGGKGNTLGFIIGVPPTVSSISSSVATNRIRYNPETSLHLEALYKIKMSENLDITPGVLLITSPESQPGVGGSRGSEFVGTVRTTFRF
jgi:Carbohydrate-selective porin, OprB family